MSFPENFTTFEFVSDCLGADLEMEIDSIKNQISEIKNSIDNIYVEEVNIQNWRVFI